MDDFMRRVRLAELEADRARHARAVERFDKVTGQSSMEREARRLIEDGVRSLEARGHRYTDPTPQGRALREAMRGGAKVIDDRRRQYMDADAADVLGTVTIGGKTVYEGRR